MKKIIISGISALVVLFSVLIGLHAYAVNSLEYQGADMGNIDVGSMSAPMTIKINNPSPIPVVIDKVEINSTYKGSHFADASFNDLYIPANKVSQHSGYLVIDRHVVQNLIFKGIAEAFQDKSAGLDKNGLAATITIQSKTMGFIPFERTEALGVD